MISGSWVKPIKSNAAANLSLICFPYAGGSAHIFNCWQALISDKCELLAIQYPGRAERFSEDLINDCRLLAEKIAIELQSLKGQSLILLGYSMGGLISFEVAKYLQQMGASNLCHHIICAGAPERTIRETGERYKYSEGDLSEELTKLGGTEQLLFQNEALRELYFPVIRSDFELVDRYKIDFCSKVKGDYTVIYGIEDESTRVEDLDKWKLLFDGHGVYQKIEAGHFFINSHAQHLLGFINQLIERFASKTSSYPSARLDTVA